MKGNTMGVAYEENNSSRTQRIDKLGTFKTKHKTNKQIKRRNMYRDHNHQNRNKTKPKSSKDSSNNRGKQFSV